MRLRVLHFCCVAAWVLATSAVAQTFDFSNIQNWVGAGPNQAAFVVAWYDGKTPDPMVWGYKWSGSAPTVLGMMQAIQAADSKFSFTPHPLFSSPPSYVVYSVFYDLTGLGGTPTVGLPANLGGKEDGFPPYPGDHYREGWKINGFWGEVIGVGNPYNGGSWNYRSAKGVGFDTISNNAWYGLSFSTDETNFTVPSPPVPVVPTTVPTTPGPATAGLLVLATVALAARSLRRHSHRTPSP
jgi:hypothetical protein